MHGSFAPLVDTGVMTHAISADLSQQVAKIVIGCLHCLMVTRLNDVGVIPGLGNSLRELAIRWLIAELQIRVYEICCLCHEHGITDTAVRFCLVTHFFKHQ